jgi:hypothetical protein
MPSFLKSLGAYAIAQVRANPVALFNIGGGLLNGAINRAPVPPQVKSLIKGLTAAVVTVGAASLVTPTVKVKGKS